MGEMTVASFFTSIGETVTGLITSGANVFSALWATGVPGQVVCSLGFASMAIGFGMGIYAIGKNLKRRRR